MDAYTLDLIKRGYEAADAIDAAHIATHPFGTDEAATIREVLTHLRACLLEKRLDEKETEKTHHVFPG